MKIKRIKNLLFAAHFMLFCCYAMQAQFHTLYPKDKIQPLADDTMRDETIGGNLEITSRAPGVQTIQINEREKILLNGMSKRQNLALPIDEISLTSAYGYRTDPFTGKRKFHRGIDLDADFHYIYSIMPGKVIKSGKNRTLGEFIQIEHGEFVTTYAHLFQRLVDAREFVEAGQRIGVSGSTGRSTGEHLHFQMSFKGKSIDPAPVLMYIQYVMQEARKEIEDTIRELTIIP
jgi:murein DD-endopeptidase MepM/ murein hydrolase activator NlpD